MYYCIFYFFLGLGGNSPKEENKGVTQHLLKNQPPSSTVIMPAANGVVTSQAILTKQGIVTSQGLITSQGHVIQGQPQIITSQIGAPTVIAATLIPNHIGPQVATTTVISGQLIQNPQFVNAAGQPVLFQQMTPAQQLQLQQMQLQHQAQHLKKVRGRDQTASLLQQQAVLQQQLQQGKISPTPLRKDLASGIAGLQQQLGNKLGRVASSLPTAALLSHSTISTSDAKQRIAGQTGESALSSLQR